MIARLLCLLGIRSDEDYRRRFTESPARGERIACSGGYAREARR